MSTSPCASDSKIRLSPAQILLDDTDPRIIFDDNWQKVSDLKGSSRGPPYGGSSHAASNNQTSNPSSMTFSFRGTAFSILGGLQELTTPANASGWNATCEIDGRSAWDHNPLISDLLCGAENLTDSEHHVNFTVHYRDNSQNHTYLTLVDAVQYTPSPEAPANDSEVQLVDPCGGEVDYLQSLSDWSPFIDGYSSDDPAGFNVRWRSVITTTDGAQLQYNFTGTKLRWYAGARSFNNNLPPVASRNSTATFSITAGEPEIIQLIPPDTKVGSHSATLLYETSDLPYGRHKLFVVYHGSHDTYPLSLAYLVVNGTSVGSDNSTLPPNMDSHGHVISPLCGGLVNLLALTIILFSDLIHH